jgi:hypothetical protein
MIGAQPNEQAPRRGDVVTARAIAKSGRVLYAFSQFYLPLYGKEPTELFWHYDLFAWISAYIYDIDEQVEASFDPKPALLRLGHLSDFLRERIRIDCEVACLFDDALRYYRFEHEVVRGGANYTLDDLVEITSLRSFDFRILHRTLAQCSGIGYREGLFNWFRAFEMLMEIEDDMSSVEEDSTRRTFNVGSLALRLSPETAEGFVLHIRQQAESEIEVRTGSLPQAERDLCSRTMAAYRSIVPRTVSWGEAT